MMPLTTSPSHFPWSPSWRWELGVELAESSGGALFRRDDWAIKAAKQFWRLWQGCRSEYDRRIVAARMPRIYHAYSIYRDADGVARNRLEARVLAGETPDGIVRKTGIPAAIVAIYEQMFFDIREHLNSPDFILSRVLGRRLYESNWTYDMTWKFFGYFGGSFVLDQLMDTCAPSARPTNIQEVAVFLSRDARAVVSRQLAVASRVIAAGDRRTANQLVRATASRAGGNDEEDNSTLAHLSKHVQAMFDSIPWSFGGKHEEGSLLAEYDKLSIEPRDKQVQLLAMGIEPPELAQLKKELHTRPPGHPKAVKRKPSIQLP